MLDKLFAPAYWPCWAQTLIAFPLAFAFSCFLIVAVIFACMAGFWPLFVIALITMSLCGTLEGSHKLWSIAAALALTIFLWNPLTAILSDHPPMIERVVGVIAAAFVLAKGFFVFAFCFGLCVFLLVIVTWGLPAVWTLVVNPNNHKARETIRYLFLGSKLR